ncbi:glycosyltransferase [Actinomycetota bacterium]
MKKILYISGSLGLGHIARDLAIAKELRSQFPDVEINWIAYEPALSVLIRAGEKTVPEFDSYNNDNLQAEATSKGTELSLLMYSFKSLGKWFQNANLVKKILKQNDFDLIIGDETYELLIPLILKTLKFDIPFVIIYDFLGLDAMSNNPIEHLIGFLMNWLWSLDHRIFSKSNNLALFVGELKDVPVKRFSIIAPNRREYARKYYNFLGYILPFNPDEYNDKKRIRKKLGYDNKPLVICSIGGTSIGKELLELCAEAYPMVKEKIPDLHMVLVCGPRLPIESLNIPKDMDIRQFVPDLFEHFAASDLAVVQGGGSTTLELTALKKPFIYFPLVGHTEQENISLRLQSYRAGIRMSYVDTDAKMLAGAIIKNISTNVNYKDIPLNGSKNAVELLSKFF